MEFFKTDKRNALESIEYAQWIAHAPIVFQASRVLRDSGILQKVRDSGVNGITLEEVVKQTGIPHYGVRVLLEAGLGIGLVTVNDGKFNLTNTGSFILSDDMTRVNMDFVQDVCYKGFFNLEDSISKENNEGLKVFGNWPTLYEALAHLPKQVQKSWLSYDHFYSDDVFAKVLPMVFKNKHKRLLDIGGNTGKWSIACANFNSDVHLTIVDLPGQIKMASENINNLGLSERISFYETNVLDENQKFPTGYDAIWMSQFLDCFSEKEIVSILKRCREAVTEDGFIYILEPFWDLQRFEAAAFSLQMSSLYFTVIANGNSQMYNSEVFMKCVTEAGLKVEEQVNNVGIIQTLLKCKKG